MAGPGDGMTVLPQYQGDYYTLQRQQALAQALAQQATTPQQIQATGSGPYTVMPKYSLGAGAAQLGEALLAAKLGNQVSQGYQNLGAGQAAAFGFGQQQPAPQQGTTPNPFSSDQGGASAGSSAAGGPQVSAAPQQGAQAAPMQSSASPMNPLGLPPALAYSAYAADHAKYAEMQAAAFKPADIVAQIRAAGIDPNSTLGKQLAQQALAKANYIPPTSIRGQFYADADGVHALPAPAPEGFQQVPDGRGGFQIVQQQGGPQAVQANAAAVAGGKAQFDVMPGFRNGQPVYTTAADIANGVNGAPGGGAAPGGTGINAGRFGGYQAPGSGPVAPSLAPGVENSANKVSGANADRYNQAVQFGVDSLTRQNVLDNISTLSASGVPSGPTEDWQQKVIGSIANMPLISKLPGMQQAQDNAAKFQELKKFLNQNGLRAWQAAGGTGTDSQMDAAMHANPNDTMFPQALQTMAAWAKAGEQAGVARANFYQQFKNNNGGVSNLDQADQTWRNNFDPKVFQLQTYAPAQQQALLNSLTPAQAKDLMAKRAWFKQNGLLQ